MIKEFYIDSNEYLTKKTLGYYNRYYTGFQNPDNPDFLNVLKNTFNKDTEYNLATARETVTNILVDDIIDIMRKHMSKCICVCIPRAKSLHTYTNSQLMLLEAIGNAIGIIDYEYENYQDDGAGNIINMGDFVIDDGTDCIIRMINTRTTHLRESTGRTTKTGSVYDNDGDLPYPGITNATCKIDTSKINGQNVILIDDIYTKNVNIDEDCIQALYDNGAKNVIFYAIGYTRRN